VTHTTALHAEPFTRQELADFEQLIFASNNPDHKIRLAARATLAQFVNQHGKFKCDLMLAEAGKFYDAKRPALDS
jgi:hypothetical protein